METSNYTTYDKPYQEKKRFFFEKITENSQPKS